jgi:hypothetical protein
MLQGDDNKTLGKFLGEINNHEEHRYRGEDESMWKESQLRQSVACEQQFTRSDLEPSVDDVHIGLLVETGIEIERRKTTKLLCHAL